MTSSSEVFFFLTRYFAFSFSVWSRLHCGVFPSQWGSKAFRNMRIIPPGSGIVHQVNLEYLARVVFKHDGYFYPDSLVGTDSHTTMIDGLGVLGWGKVYLPPPFFICYQSSFSTKDVGS